MNRRGIEEMMIRIEGLKAVMIKVRGVGGGYVA